MIKENLSVRELKESDFENIIDYFLHADKDFLIAMGVDTSKLPKRGEWLKLLANEFHRNPDEKKLFVLLRQRKIKPP